MTVASLLGLKNTLFIFGRKNGRFVVQYGILFCLFVATFPILAYLFFIN